MLKKVLIGVAVVIALAGCASTATHHAASKPNKVAAASSPTHSPSCGQDGYMCSSVPSPASSSAHRPRGNRWFKAGLAFGKSTAIPNETDGQYHAHCKENMPIGANKANWMAGCFGGTILGLVAIDQSNGG